MGATNGYIYYFEIISAPPNFNCRLWLLSLMKSEIEHFAWRNIRYDNDGESSADGDIALAHFDDPGLEAPADVPILFGQICYEYILIDIAVGKGRGNLQKNNPVVQYVLNGGRFNYSMFQDNIYCLSDLDLRQGSFPFPFAMAV